MLGQSHTQGRCSMDISSLSSFSQLTVTSKLTLGSYHAQTCRLHCWLLLVWLQLCFWQEAASYMWKNIYIYIFLTVSYFSKKKIEMHNLRIEMIGDFFLPPPYIVTYLHEKSFKTNIINSHSIVYSKKYLFWRMKLHQKKENSEGKKKTLIDIETVRDSIAITNAPSSFANH